MPSRQLAATSSLVMAAVLALLALPALALGLAETLRHSGYTRVISSD